MGRNKIKIEKIKNQKIRHITLIKRKKGLLKKAIELSILCDSRVLLCVLSNEDVPLIYTSDGSFNKMINDIISTTQTTEKVLSNTNYQKLFIGRKKNSNNNSLHSEEDEKSNESIKKDLVRCSSIQSDLSRMKSRLSLRVDVNEVRRNSGFSERDRFDRSNELSPIQKEMNTINFAPDQISQSKINDYLPNYNPLSGFPVNSCTSQDPFKNRIEHDLNGMISPNTLKSFSPLFSTDNLNQNENSFNLFKFISTTSPVQKGSQRSLFMVGFPKEKSGETNEISPMNKDKISLDPNNYMNHKDFLNPQNSNLNIDIPNFKQEQIKNIELGYEDLKAEKGKINSLNRNANILNIHNCCNETNKVEENDNNLGFYSWVINGSPHSKKLETDSKKKTHKSKSTISDK